MLRSICTKCMGRKKKFNLQSCQVEGCSPLGTLTCPRSASQHAAWHLQWWWVDLMCWEGKTKRTESYEDQSNNILKLFDKQRIPYWTIKKTQKNPLRLLVPRKHIIYSSAGCCPQLTFSFFQFFEKETNQQRMSAVCYLSLAWSDGIIYSSLSTWTNSREQTLTINCQGDVSFCNSDARHDGLAGVCSSVFLGNSLQVQGVTVAEHLVRDPQRQVISVC